MVYMSKTKRKRVRRQNLIRLAIVLAVIAAILVLIWQASLGSVLARVDGTPIRSGMVNGVESFLEYIQTGQFTDRSTRGLTSEEKSSLEDMRIVQRNSLVQSVFIANEVLKQHFAAEGIAFPTEEQQLEIDQYKEMYYGTPELVSMFRSNGVKQQHVDYYFEYVVIMSAFREKIAEENPVSDDDALAYYNENLEYFVTPFSMQASHILLLDEDHTDARRAEMQAILDRLNNGEDFAELATLLSEDGSAESGGDLGTFGLGQMVAEFEEACLALEPGEISGIVETEYGFHIIKMTQKNEETTATFEEARETIDSTLTSERSSEAMDALIEAANITYKGLINPTTGKPPISLAELDEARGTTDDADDADSATEEDEYGEDHDPNDGGDHEGHDHD